MTNAEVDAMLVGIRQRRHIGVGKTNGLSPRYRFSFVTFWKGICLFYKVGSVAEKKKHIHI